MVERKLFKTKLCVLYQKGHCPRHNCSFAHGRAELRQFSSSYYGKRDYHGDLRDRLDRRLSPRRRYSPERGTRSRRTFHRSSSSRSPYRNGDRKRTRKQQIDRQSDFSGSLKNSDGVEDQIKERKHRSNSKFIRNEQLKEVLSDINLLARHKSQLKISVNEKVEEAESLASKIQELHSELSKEKDECKRITSKIKKFVKAHKNCMRIQDELKRSQARLNRLGDQLDSGFADEDSNVNVVSDGDVTGYYAIGNLNELQINSSPGKKLSIKLNASEELQKANLTSEAKYRADSVKSGNLARVNPHFAESSVKGAESMENRSNVYHQPAGSDGKLKRWKGISVVIPSDKPKGSQSALALPSTSMAAHALDEALEIEADENLAMIEAISTGIDDIAEADGLKLQFSLPPPPLFSQNSYLQRAREDLNQKIGAMEEEITDVEIV